MDPKDRQFLREIIAAHEKRSRASWTLLVVGVGFVFGAFAAPEGLAPILGALGGILALAQAQDLGQIRAMRIAKQYAFRDEIPNAFATKDEAEALP